MMALGAVSLCKAPCLGVQSHIKVSYRAGWENSGGAVLMQCNRPRNADPLPALTAVLSCALLHVKRAGS